VARITDICEKAGIPAALIVTEGFVDTARETSEGEGVFGLPIAAYPGHTAVDTMELLTKKTTEIVLPAVINILTVQPPAVTQLPGEHEPTDIVFKGTFEEVNTYYLKQIWGDGLPIVPPTLAKVQEFMKYSPLPADAKIGSLPTAYRMATPWNIAVNGVMAGCRPQYMPVLVAIAQVMAEPDFDLNDAGSTGSWEVVAILSGPLMKQLGFNFGQGMLRAGVQANTSVGRFTRFMMRNIAGFLKGIFDLASYGRDYFNLVFVEDEVYSPWPPLSVTDRGFKAGTNLVTLQGLTLMSKHCQPEGKTADEMLDLLSRLCEFAATEGAFFVIRDSFAPKGSHDLYCITPLIANKIAEKYTKQQAQQYIWDHARIPASRVEARHAYDLPFKLADQKLLPKEFFLSTDPDRPVPLWGSPKDIEIFVGGDWSRNRCFLGRGTGRMGFTTSKEVQLPANWSTLVPKDLT
jgi:hypothetical protein